MQNDPTDIYKALNLADMLRERDILIHDGGSVQKESISTYHTAIHLIQQERDKLLQSPNGNELVNQRYNPQGNDRIEGDINNNNQYGNANDELLLDKQNKSINGLLLHSYCSLAKQYYMANMFETAVELYDAALEIESNYLDALCYRASTYIILGRYEEAGGDYSKLLDLDVNHLFVDSYSGVTKVLLSKEDSIPNGMLSSVFILIVVSLKQMTRFSL